MSPESEVYNDDHAGGGRGLEAENRIGWRREETSHDEMVLDPQGGREGVSFSSRPGYKDGFTISFRVTGDVVRAENRGPVGGWARARGWSTTAPRTAGS